MQLQWYTVIPVNTVIPVHIVITFGDSFLVYQFVVVFWYIPVLRYTFHTDTKSNTAIPVSDFNTVNPNVRYFLVTNISTTALICKRIGIQ